MGASPTCPTQRGSGASTSRLSSAQPYAASCQAHRPPGSYSSNRGAPKLPPNPPILGSSPGHAVAGRVKLAQALPGSWPCLQPRAFLPCAGCLWHPSPGGVRPPGQSVSLLPREGNLQGAAPGPRARGSQPQPGPRQFLPSLARRPARGQLVSSLGAAVGKSGAVGCRVVAGRAGSLGSGWLTRKHFSL